MKKVFIIIALFIVPICAYLFFASGLNSFIKLPVITEKINDMPSSWVSNTGQKVFLKGKITILGFTGSEISNIKGNVTNLAHKIYAKNNGFVDFQVIYVVPEGLESQIQTEIIEPLDRNIDFTSLKFVFAPKNEIQDFFKGLKTVSKLDNEASTPMVFIIDKELKLRGRNGRNKKGEQEYREAYDTRSAADLHNEMSDDVKVILAEYRLELKKNNTSYNVTE